MKKFKDEKYIKQRKNNSTDSWSFQVRIGKTTKTFNEKNYGSARAAYNNAIYYRNKTLSTIDEGAYSYSNNVRLTDVFEDTFELMPVREETKRKHQMFFDRYFPVNKYISNINQVDIIKSLNLMVNDCSDDSISRALSLWRKIYKVAIVQGFVAKDITIGIVPPKSQMIKKNKRKFVTDRNTLNAVKEAIMHTFCEQEAKSVCMGLEIMWYLGLRPAECFALTKDDIKDGRVSINKELGSPIASRNGLGKRNNSIVRKCKTEASIRDIPIPEKLQKLLDSYHVKGKILLPNKSNEHFNVCLLGQRIRKLGIPFNMYQLRHTLATRLIVAHVDERTIIEILGHEHINMSIYYARSNDGLKANALNNIND